MKKIVALGFLSLSLGMGVDALAITDCSIPKLISSIQKKCGGRVTLAAGKIGYYQGEVTDTYIIPIKNGARRKYMSVTAEGGNCVDQTIDVKSTCP